MSMTNDDNAKKYQVASTDEYGIKMTKGGQKYLICHFIRDDFADKYAYTEVIKKSRTGYIYFIRKRM